MRCDVCGRATDPKGSDTIKTVRFCGRRRCQTAFGEASARQHVNRGVLDVLGEYNAVALSRGGDPA